MRRLVLAVFAAALVALPLQAMAADQSASHSGNVGVDAKILTNAKVQQNGKDVGSVERVMIDPSSGRIDHVDIKMTSGQNRTISVPWRDLKVQQDNRGNITVAMTGQAAESSPAASPKTTDHDNYKHNNR